MMLRSRFFEECACLELVEGRTPAGRAPGQDLTPHFPLAPLLRFAIGAEAGLLSGSWSAAGVPGLRAKTFA